MNLTTTLEVIYKSTLVFFILLIIARLLGKKQLSQLTYFNYITGITIGSIAANTLDINKDTGLDEITALIIWSLLTYLIGYVTIKSHILKSIIDGQPDILIKKGKIQMPVLKKMHLNIDELVMMLREKEIFNIREVDYAILETNGKVSILKEPPYQNVTNQTMNLKTKKPKYIPTQVIIDGEIHKRNLKELGLTENWIKKQLKKQNTKNYKNVIYAEIQDDGTLFIDKKK